MAFTRLSIFEIISALKNRIIIIYQLRREKLKLSLLDPHNNDILDAALTFTHEDNSKPKIENMESLLVTKFYEIIVYAIHNIPCFNGVTGH